MFSYGLYERGRGYLITESCAVAKKIYRKQERMSILSSAEKHFFLVGLEFWPWKF